jgi:MbtH protein
MKTFSHLLAFLVIIFIIVPSSVTAQNKGEYKVVINHEEQYSIWPINKKLHKGWQETEVYGNQAKCHEYIEEVWTDMRPLSIQKMNLPEDTEYFVVINHEEQYSIWPKELALPDSWRQTKTHGTLYPCVKYIKKVWTDMRPLSLRNVREKRKY